MALSITPGFSYCNDPCFLKDSAILQNSCSVFRPYWNSSTEGQGGGGEIEKEREGQAFNHPGFLCLSVVNVATIRVKLYKATAWTNSLQVFLGPFVLSAHESLFQ